MIQSYSFSLAETPAALQAGKMLFLEYAQSLNIDLSFQNFENELKQMEPMYSKPDGALVLVYKDGEAIGCAGVRRIDETTAELKRMFVRPEFRKNGVGRRLLFYCLDVASALGYQKIRLDTLESMKAAQQLYRSAGFLEIEAYNFHPVPGTIYMEKRIS